jgi:hypothetical protein
MAAWRLERGRRRSESSQPRFRHRQSSWCDVTMSSTYLATSASSISEGTRTGTSLPSTSFLFSLTTSSLLQRVHRTRSLPWQTHPLLAHCTSATGFGLGVQSVSSWKLARRLSNSSLSPGQYLGLKMVSLSLLPGAHFFRTILDMVVWPAAPSGGVLVPSCLDGVESATPSRRRLVRRSRSDVVVADRGAEEREVRIAMESEPGVRVDEGAEARVVVVKVRFGGGVCGMDSSSGAVFDSGCGGMGSVGYEGRVPRPFKRALSLRFFAKSMVCCGCVLPRAWPWK